MRHFILASAGTHGDVFPFVALGIALRERGHRVTLAVNEPYRQMAIDHGFQFAPLVSEAETNEFLADPDLWHPVKCGLVGARWGNRWLIQQYETLSRLASDTDSVMAASPGIIAARVVQEKLRCPLASIYYTPWMIPSCTAPPAMTGPWSLPHWAPQPIGHMYWRLIDLAGSLLLGRQLNELRHSLGLKSIRRIFQWWISPDLAIAMFPEWYAPPQPDWPPQMRIAGFPMFDGQQEEPLDAQVLDFCRTGNAPVLFTFGTGMRHAAELFQESVEACGHAGVRGILLTRHQEHLPDELPDFVRHFDYVPLRQLLPHCAAIVHHGGIGTVANALDTGTPQLIIPHAWDQLDNAKRVVQLGAGKMLGRKRATCTRISREIVAMSEQDTVSQCRMFANRSGDENAVDSAATWVEELGNESNGAKPFRGPDELRDN